MFPRRNLELLGEHGFLGLTVPEEYGGLGEDHVAYSMVCETIARYGCASTAMCYVMHIGAVNAIMLRATPELIDKYIRPLNSGKIGTLSYSDPETGSHFWYPISSGAERSNGGFKVRKKASWTTSGGFADFYVVQTTSPDFSGYDDLSVFVVDGEHIQAQPSLWDALGLRGNQSGPIEIDNMEIPAEQLVGPTGDGANSNDESVDPWFLVGSASVWNGLALGAIDIAKRHTTRKKHVDVGMRVADYPTIQDYVGEAVMDTNASRLFTLSVAQAMDGATENNTVNPGPGELARGNFLHWAWQIKFEAAKNTAHVVDKMLHACGGSGYKRDMELERYLRDAKAGWVMGPTNEVLRQFVGKAVLLGFESLDYWNQSYNRRAVENEVKKLDAAGQARAGRTALQGGRPAGVEGARGQGLISMAISAGRRSFTVPGLLPSDPFLERYWVRAGGATGDHDRRRRPAHRARPGRRSGRGDDGARPGRVRGRRGARFPGRRPRHRPPLVDRLGGRRCRRRDRRPGRARPVPGGRDGRARSSESGRRPVRRRRSSRSGRSSW